MVPKKREWFVSFCVRSETATNAISSDRSRCLLNPDSITVEDQDYISQNAGNAYTAWDRVSLCQFRVHVFFFHA